MNRPGEGVLIQQTTVSATPSARSGALALLLFLSACVSVDKPEPRDGGPERPVDVSGVKDAVPRQEPRTRAGNASPYTVFGKEYHVLRSSRGFRQTGVASWYGTKFHGRTTANGEIYDMFAMTAAHKSLPIPSYVKVTNLDNGRSVVVRVNDRGPFHGDRIIDLTYAAAAKLDFVDRGIATVEVVALEPGQSAAQAAAIEADTAVKEPFLQAGAFGSKSAALALRQRLSQLTTLPVTVKKGRGGDLLYRVHIGPVDDSQIAELKSLLQRRQQVSAHVVYR